MHPNISGHPDGAAATRFLAEQRRDRIQRERRSRPDPTLLEQQAAREQRARGREIDDFMSAASVYTAEEVRLQQV